MIKRNKKGQFVKGNKPTHGFKKGLIPWSKSQKGIHLSPKSEFKKGRTPWNKGKKLHYKVASPFKKGKHYGKATEFKEGHKTWNKGIEYVQIKGDKHPFWKGDKVSYGALHSWVYRRLGKPKECEHCEIKSKKLAWANKSHEYKRDLNDWISLCYSCHKLYDLYGK